MGCHPDSPFRYGFGSGGCPKTACARLRIGTILHQQLRLELVPKRVERAHLQDDPALPREVYTTVDQHLEF